MFVQRPDARLFSLSFGQGPITLLALGGWVGSGELWHPLFGHLPQWRCVSYDHRGSGASTQQGPITVEAMVEDLFAVADAQGVGRCVLAAESSGAGIALEAALRQPQRFAGLVLAGAGWRQAAAGSQEAGITALRQNYAGTLKAFVDRCLPEPGSEDLRRWGLQVVSRAPLESAIELMRCREQVAVEDRVASLKLPTLLVHGELDRIVPPESSRELARRLSDAELHVLPGLGHVPIATAPQQVAQLIERRFINSEAQR